jgi:purine nucleosidase
MTARLPVILDVDTGIDDSLAILYACASPELELVGVTTVAGNEALDQVTANTLAVLELVGRGDVPVTPGAAKPLHKPLVTTPETHGPDGIGHARLAAAARAVEPGDAADFLVSQAHRRPGEIHLVTLGPMTNLALALEREPRLPALLGGWTFMGGAFRVAGNTTPRAEWNVHVDPDAAKACLSAWSAVLASDGSVRLPLGMGLDVTQLARILPGDVARLARRAGAAQHDAAALAEPGNSDGLAELGDPYARLRPRDTVAANPVLHFVADALRFYFEFHAANDAFYGAYIHDPFAVAAALDRSLVATQAVFVDVEAGPGPAHGQTIADWHGVTGHRPNVALATQASAPEFLDRLVERVGGLAARSATT